MDERNRQAAQRAGRVMPAELYVAGVQRVDAGEDLDQRGLAGTVLAEQRQDLAGAELEVNVIERERASEALGVARSQPARRGRGSGRCSRARPYLWASVEGCPCFSAGG